MVELLRHFIQAGGQHTDLVLPVDFALPGHVQCGHPFRHVADSVVIRFATLLILISGLE